MFNILLIIIQIIMGGFALLIMGIALWVVIEGLVKDLSK